MKAEREKRESAEHAARDAANIDAPVLGEPEQHGHEYPSDRIVHDGGGQDDLADRAPDEAELPHQGGDDLHRRHRERGTDEKREQEPLVRPDEHRGRQQLDRQHAEEEGQGDAGQ